MHFTEPPLPPRRRRGASGLGLTLVILGGLNLVLTAIAGLWLLNKIGGLGRPAPTESWFGLWYGGISSVIQAALCFGVARILDRPS